MGCVLFLVTGWMFGVGSSEWRNDEQRVVGAQHLLMHVGRILIRKIPATQRLVTTCFVLLLLLSVLFSSLSHLFSSLSFLSLFISLSFLSYESPLFLLFLSHWLP